MTHKETDHLPWPTVISGRWQLKEMRKSKRNPHVLKHLYSKKESWWSIIDGFTRKTIVRFEKRARQAGCVVWFPPSEVEEVSHREDDYWMKDWPSHLTDELSDNYYQHYRHYTLGMINDFEHGRLDDHWWDLKDSKGVSLRFLDDHGVLVIFRKGSTERLIWVTTYRDIIDQDDDRREEVVQIYQEASLY